MKFTFGARSLQKLNGVHPDVVRVAHRALEISELDFIVTCGLRTIKEQAALVKSGASTTMKSRHLTGHAVDLAPIGPKGQVAWDWPLFNKLAAAMKMAAAELKVPLEWGGDWKSFPDGPHFQLPWKDYPT
jgi:peptidoglycan L-alanyl-D-glutamate endopeptidase CwlK